MVARNGWWRWREIITSSGSSVSGQLSWEVCLWVWSVHLIHADGADDKYEYVPYQAARGYDILNHPANRPLMRLQSGLKYHRRINYIGAELRSGKLGTFSARGFSLGHAELPP